MSMIPVLSTPSATGAEARAEVHGKLSAAKIAALFRYPFDLQCADIRDRHLRCRSIATVIYNMDY